MMDRFDDTMILYRPVGLQELELIYDDGMKSFPARLPQQPIFYPVIDLEYARQIASDWNAKNGQFAGYVTQFKVEDQYISQFDKHTVGGSQYQEFWIPAEDMEEFNQHIIGHVRVLEAHFGDAFEGFVPDKFGLQGKNAVAQFTLLANSYLYNRMDFYLEIKRNHKAVFLNYPFWQKYDFKNPGLKEKILQAIKEAWLTSFPKIPLANPVSEDIAPVEQTDSPSLTNPAHEEVAHVKQIDSPSLTNPIHQDTTPRKQKVSHFSQGLEFGLSGKYHEAIDELSKAVEEDPDHVVAHTSLGVAFHRLGEDERALSCYEAALKLNPKYAEAHYFQANILYSQGNVREAIGEFTLALGLKPELIDAHEEDTPQDRLIDYNRSPAEMYWIAKPAHRILDLNKSLESNPRQANLFKERAAQYYRLWNYEQAIADYSSSLVIQPDDASALHNRGLAYEQVGQIDHALADYQRAIAINPQLANVHINRGVTFGKMGNLRQSIASLTEGIRLDPQNPDGYFNRGVSYFQQGDLKSAIDDFSNVIQLSPGDEAAYYWRGISNEEAGRQREAIADYRQFLKLTQNLRAREEIEQKLRQWNEGETNGLSSRSVDKRQKTNYVKSEKPDQDLDLYGLITALGERALKSTWLGSGVQCYGESAEELFSFTDHNQPIKGNDFLRITSGIHKTTEGDFTAFDPGSTPHWILVRAWEGRGFYIEINDPKSKEQLTTNFPQIDEVEGATPPYEGLFIHI